MIMSKEYCAALELHITLECTVRYQVQKSIHIPPLLKILLPKALAELAFLSQLMEYKIELYALVDEMQLDL